MRLDTLIVDDELNCRENLNLLINEFCPGLNVVGKASCVSQAKALINSYNPKLVFLDIAMPGGDGFELLEAYKERGFSVVFTTAYDEYALKAFKNDAIGYIEKPIDIDELKKAEQKAIALHSYNDDTETIPLFLNNKVSHDDEIEKISVPTRNGITMIENREIVYMDSLDNYTEIHLSSGRKILSSKTIKFYEDRINKNIFFRCHRSHIINVQNHLKEFSRTDGNYAVLSNGKLIPISRRKLSLFLQRINFH